LGFQRLDNYWVSLTFMGAEPTLNSMTDRGQENEVEILGCRVKTRPEDDDREIAQTVIAQVQNEVAELLKARPSMRQTDVAVLVALKMATEKVKLEQEFKTAVLRLEGSVEQAMSQLQNRS
jgi:cell division protein ZapA (FtsZ GTPase activity inhibitor)